MSASPRSRRRADTAASLSHRGRFSASSPGLHRQVTTGAHAPTTIPFAHIHTEVITIMRRNRRALAGAVLAAGALAGTVVAAPGDKPGFTPVGTANTRDA